MAIHLWQSDETLLEQFSTECRKNKTKVITLTKDAEQSIVQSKLEAFTLSAGKLARASHD